MSIRRDSETQTAFAICCIQDEETDACIDALIALAEEGKPANYLTAVRVLSERVDARDD